MDLSSPSGRRREKPDDGGQAVGSRLSIKFMEPKRNLSLFLLAQPEGITLGHFGDALEDHAVRRVKFNDIS
jgi:hypothetical protein